MIERKINRVKLIEILNKLRYEDVSELQMHCIFSKNGYVDEFYTEQNYSEGNKE